MKNKKTIIALGALAVVGLVAGTIAYFTSEVSFDNVFSTAIYKTKSTEVFESPDNWTPGTNTPKTLTTKNEGTIPVAVRVSKSEKWYGEGYSAELSDAEKQALEIDSEDVPDNAVIIHTTLEDAETGVEGNPDSWDWIKHTDGYWYYKNALAPDATTTSFIRSVELSSDLDVTSVCGDPVETVVEGKKTTTKTCTTSIDGLGKATYVLTLTVETVQFDQYQRVWTTAPTLTAPASNNNGD
jgi:alternate signal-mediated exported protein